MVEVDFEVDEKELIALREKLQAELDLKVAEEKKKILGKDWKSEEEYRNDPRIDPEMREEFLIRMQEKAEERVYNPYFNNWLFNLPDDRHPGGGFYRMPLPNPNLTFGQLARNSAKSYKRSQGREPAEVPYSLLKASQTRAQFFATIDRVIEKEGIPRDELQALQDLHYKEVRDAPLYKLTFPVYTRLLVMGYNDFDLTA